MPTILITGAAGRIGTMLRPRLARPGRVLRLLDVVPLAAPAGPGEEAVTASVTDMAAVTAACAMIRRELYLQVDGMDAARFAVSFNDVDLCLRLRNAGYTVIYTPHCLLYHHTSASRSVASNLDEDQHLARRWGQQLVSDPYYNQHLSMREASRPRFMERIL